MKKTKVEIILNKTESSEMYTGMSFGYSNDFEFKKKENWGHMSKMLPLYYR